MSNANEADDSVELGDIRFGRGTGKSGELIVYKGSDNQPVSLKTFPKDNSLIVTAKREEIFDGINIACVVENVKKSADLVWLAWNAAAVSDSTLRTNIYELHHDLIPANFECETAMGTFASESRNIATNVLRCYEWLLKGKEDVALLALGKCGTAAANMADRAGKLATKFDELGKRAFASAKLAIAEQSKELKAQKAAAAITRAVEAEQEGFQSALTDAEKRVETAKKEYNEAKERQIKNEDRVFALAMAQIACTTVATVGSAYAGGAAGTAGSAIGALGKVAEKKADEKAATTAAKEKEDLEAKLKAAEKKLEGAKTSETTANEKYTAEKAKLGTLEPGEGTRNAAIDLEVLRSKWVDAQTERKDVEKEISGLKDQINRLAQGLFKVADQLGDHTKTMQQIAESARKDKMAFYTSMVDAEKQASATRAKVRENVEKIANLKLEEGMARTAVIALTITLAALNEVQVALIETQRFFEKIVQATSALSGQDMKDRIEEFRAGYASEAERIAQYRMVPFAAVMAEFIARCAALHYVCGAYQKAARKTGDKLKADFQTTMLPERCIEAAKAQAKVLLAGLDLEEKVAAERVAGAREKLKTLTAVAA